MIGDKIEATAPIVGWSKGNGWAWDSGPKIIPTGTRMEIEDMNSTPQHGTTIWVEVDEEMLALDLSSCGHLIREVE